MMNETEGQMRQAIGDGGEDRRDAKDFQVAQQHLEWRNIAERLAGMEIGREAL